MKKEFTDEFSLACKSKTADCCVWQKGGVRLSVIAGRLLRVEVNKKGVFEDRPTQKIWYRDFARPKTEFIAEKNKITVKTPHAEFVFDLSREKLESVLLSDGRRVKNFKKGNLKGTYRTLDGTIGPVPLGDGLVSTGGVTVLDDSASLALNPDGTIEPRKCAEKDLYYFAYGNDFRGCIRDFYNLSGKVPLVPRWALGNWWSRYKAYTQPEYLALMKRFRDEEIPITVATVDMDWHWVDVKTKFGKEKEDMDNRYHSDAYWGSGWTGYSWNTDLFPDYKAFLKELKDNDYKITLNLHPADGVRWFEEQYEGIAKELGYDTAKKERVKFEIGNPDFVSAYFKYLHHPYENEGVDFWWIDWQQGKNSGVKGLDPLWALNHYHYLDNGRSDKRGMILSRYAQVGSHRYPLGFSGDTMVSWSCLKFQPYFTANAANAGYTWWSHDIGGHHRCKKDDELYIRWIEFGVFSPIMRLHSTSNEFMGKEPWKYRYDARVLATEYMRLRHRLIPYIYSMNYRNHKDGVALCEPMYYAHAEKKEAYTVPNQYYFGSELIAAPITEPMDKKTNRASARVWLPEGRFTDVFTGAIYEGGKYYDMFRGIESVPVLAKEGAIIPLSADGKGNNWRNPKALDVLVYRGSGSFSLYEDDGETKAFESGASAITKFTVKEDGKDLVFTISAAEGDLSQIPEKRDYTIHFKDIANVNVTQCSAEEPHCSLEKDTKHGCMKLIIRGADVASAHTFTLKSVTARENPPAAEAMSDVVSSYQLGVDYKRAVYEKLVKNPLLKIPGTKRFKGPLAELADIYKKNK